MAKVTSVKEEIPMESAFMGVFWNFIKYYWNPEEDDSYWSELADSPEKISKYMEAEAEKQGKKIDKDFCECLVLGYVKYLERKYKKTHPGRK